MNVSDMNNMTARQKDREKEGEREGMKEGYSYI